MAYGSVDAESGSGAWTDKEEGDARLEDRCVTACRRDACWAVGGSLVMPEIHTSMIFMANKECPYKSSWIL